MQIFTIHYIILNETIRMAFVTLFTQERTTNTYKAILGFLREFATSKTRKLSPHPILMVLHPILNFLHLILKS